MKEIFNINRFSALWLKTNRENLKTNLILLAVIAVVTFLCLCKFNPFTPEYSVIDSESAKMAFEGLHAERQYAVFWGVMFFFSIIVAARSFKDIMSPHKAINTLLLPASSFEKYLLAFLNSTVVFFLVYLVLFYGLDWLVNTYKYSGVSQANFTMGVFGTRIPVIEEGQQLTKPVLVNVLNLTSENSNISKMADSNYNIMGPLSVLGFWLYIIAMFMWGSITFRRRTILLTSLLHLLLFIGIGFAVYAIVRGVIDTYSLGFADCWMINVDHGTPSPYWGLLFYLLPIAYLWVVWMKLKRKQLK